MVTRLLMMVDEGSIFTEDPDAKLPAEMYATSDPAAVDVPVASSIKVPPVDSTLKSVVSEEVGILMLYVPFAAEVTGPAIV